ncbi:MAG TPA: ATP-binding protein [Methylomirabilota bacterium]|nr:ATP-binding protein [Methylomirabilota bacterium]
MSVTPASWPVPVAPPPPPRPRQGGATLLSSPTRQFVVLSLLTIGASTFLFGVALGYFVERGILDREWGSTAALVRTAARFHLRPGDFRSPLAGSGQPPGRPSDEAADRFEELARQLRMLPEVLRLVVYDGRGGVFWTDAERGDPPPSPQGWLGKALAGETSVRFEPGRGEAPPRVELYVPITFPGEGRVAGVIETSLDPGRVLATVRQARVTLWALALLSGVALYAALYGIVWRASRALRAQHAALTQRADELARTNAELRAVQQQLVAAERLAAFGEITAAVAHGLGNPLAAIRGLAQVALLDTSPGPAGERLRQVIAETDRLAERMRALLRYGRPVEQRRVPTALDAAVASALEPLRRRAEARGIRLDVAVSGELPKVGVDPARFEEAFLCLVNNALEAMPDGGVLQVVSRPAPGGAGELELAIEDTGPGMSAAMLARAFEPFFTTKAGGTGLGLALARKLLEGAGGRLALESEPGRGTRAIITLPREEA